MIVRVWNRFWFERVGGTSFALVRILFSIMALITLLELAPLLAEHYTADGYFPIDSARQWSWGNLIGFLHVQALDGLPQVTVLYTALLLSVTLLGLGWHTRSASALTFILLLWFQTRNPTFLNGGDEVLRLTAFYLFLGYLVVHPEERTLSIDRWRSGSGADGTDGPVSRPVGGVLLGGHMAVWPVRMIQIQICVLYFIAGWWKLSGESWWSADAVYYALQNPQVARFVVPGAAWMEPFFLAASLSVAWWEFLFPALYAIRPTRRFALLFGVMLHTGILLTMNIGFFPLVVLATYPAFISPRRTRAFVAGLLRRAGVQVEDVPQMGGGFPAVAEP